MRLLLLITFFSVTACAYNWGHSGRALPNGYKTVYVEVFNNQTQEVGVEIEFTNALIKEVERSGFAVITDKSSADLIISGNILSISFVGSASVTGKSFFSDNHEASLFTSYSYRAMAYIKARKNSDNKEIWSTTIDGSTSYQSSKLTQIGLRSSNPLYNQSARGEATKLVAQNMMTEAFDRLTENF